MQASRHARHGVELDREPPERRFARRDFRSGSLMRPKASRRRRPRAAPRRCAAASAASRRNARRTATARSRSRRRSPPAPGMVPPSPAPLTPIGLSGFGVSTWMMLQPGTSGARRQEIILERRGQRVGVGVVVHALEQRVADAVRDAALHLAVDDQRIDDRAAVVGDGVVAERARRRSSDRPRPRRHACRCNRTPAAARRTRCARGPRSARRETTTPGTPCAIRASSRERQLRLVAAARRPPRCPRRRCRFRRRPARAPRARTICLRTALPASSADEPALTAWRLAKPPTPCEIAAGVADGHDDVFDAAAELIGDDLRQRRARALALVGGAGRDRDLAVRS